MVSLYGREKKHHDVATFLSSIGTPLLLILSGICFLVMSWEYFEVGFFDKNMFDVVFNTKHNAVTKV